MAECRPKNYPKLKDYKPSRFMLSTCHYDAAKADRAVTFIENLRHTKGKWAGKRFWLLPWQEQIIRDVFGIVDERGNRQFRTAYVEIGKKNGKSELAAAVALYLLFADNEPSAEVYGAAADRQQASIVFDVAHQMVQMTPALLKRCKIMAATKRIVNYGNAGFYQVLSAEVGTKHGLNASGLVLDEVHAQPNRKLYDVLTKGSGDAREQPLFFLITTAGTDKESICYELHMKALDLLAGRKIDHTFYPVVYGLTDEDDWHDEANWYKANPSLGQTIQIQRVRDAYQEALDNPAEENVFKQLRLNMWVSSLTRFIPEHIYDLGNQLIDMETLKGRDCYGGLDLSSTGDITAFVLMFPPRTSEEKYIMLPFFWIPENTIPQRVRRASVPYDVWYQQGYLMATEGNVIHYGFIEKVIEELGKTYHILEIAFDRWGAVQMTQNLEGMGFTVVPFGQGFKDMSPPTKEFYKLLMEGRIIHGGNPVMAWMAGNVVVDTDPAGNIKPTKAKSPEKIDGIVAAIMALDRCISNELLNDSAFDLATYIARRFGVRMGNAEERAFITGDGVGKPLGLLAETGGAKVGVTAAQKDAVSFDEIFKLYYALKAPYRKKAQFLCNEALVLQLMTIKDNNGNYIWKPGLEIGKPDTLLNRPLKTSAFMPEIKGGSKVMAFGDYSYYWVADRQNRTFRRLNELYARTDQVGFLTTQRVDGKLILPEAVQLLQMAPQG